MNLFTPRALCALVLTCVASAASAGDFQSQYKEAFAKFERRGENTQHALDCADRAEAAFALGSNDVEKYDALVLESRCIYFVGMKATKDSDKITLFGHGKDVADRAKGFQRDRAEAYYYYGINLGRWAEANGILKSLGERNNLRRNEETAIQKMAVIDGQTVPGKEIDSYGPNRTLGRMYFKLPGMFGGDNAKAEALLREAVEKSVDRNSLNTLYLAETLVARGKKPEARRVLDEVLEYENDPARYNPKRTPETTDEMRDVRHLRNELGD